MNTIHFFCILLGVVYAKPSLYGFPTFYEHVAVTPSQVNLLHGIKSRFHTQDELGQYTYGYNDGLSSKIESKTADGITQGSYAYVDSNGIIQNVNYISDDVNGFRVSASNLPVAPASVHSYQFPIHEEETTLISQNPTQTMVSSSAGNEIKSNLETMSTEYESSAKQAENFKSSEEKQTAMEKQNKTNVSSEMTTILTDTTPTVTNVIPTYATYQPAVPQFTWYPQQLAPMSFTSFRYPQIPLSSVYSQFHSQDELGQYSYGYSGGPSSKVEMKTLDGITRGGYSYIDPNGILQKVNYISDPINGFRVAATNLPISNMATGYYPAEYQLPELNLISHSDKTKSD